MTPSHGSRRVGVVLGLTVMGAILVTHGWTSTRPERLYDRAHLITTAPDSAVIVTALEPSYLDGQISNFYRFTDREVAARNLRFTTGSELLTGGGLFANRPVVFDRAAEAFVSRVRRDVYGVSAKPNLAEWIGALPAGSQVAVVTTDVGDAKARAALAEAMLPIGSSSRLSKVSSAGCYVAGGTIGGDGFRERLRSDDALLPAPRRRARTEADPRSFPSMFAGSTAMGMITSFGEDLLERSGIHVYVRPPGESEWQRRTFGALPPLPEEPFSLHSGRSQPLTSVDVIVDQGATVVVDGAGAGLTVGSPMIELMVVERGRGFSKGAVRFEPSLEGLRELAVTLGALPDTDGFVVIAPGQARRIAEAEPGGQDGPALRRLRDAIVGGVSFVSGSGKDPSTWYAGRTTARLDIETMRPFAADMPN